MYHTVLMHYIPRVMGKTAQMCCQLKEGKVKKVKLVDPTSKKVVFDMVTTVIIYIVFSVFAQTLIICIDCLRRILECLIKLLQRDSH
jgi:hypothetical protein